LGPGGKERPAGDLSVGKVAADQGPEGGSKKKKKKKEKKSKRKKPGGKIRLLIPGVKRMETQKRKVLSRNAMKPYTQTWPIGNARKGDP